MQETLLIAVLSDTGSTSSRAIVDHALLILPNHVSLRVGTNVHESFWIMERLRLFGCKIESMLDTNWDAPPILRIENNLSENDEHMGSHYIPYEATSSC